MNSNTKLGLVIGAAVACLAVAFWAVSSNGDEQDGVAKSGLEQARADEARQDVRSGRRLRRAKPVAHKIRDEEALEKARKLLATYDDDDEASLTAIQRQLIADIRRALDDNDLAAILSIVQKMQKSDEWPDGIPIAIRKAAIDALGWFGGDAIPEIAGFLIDGDPEILEEAIDVYESAMFEANGDMELSQVITGAARVLNDADAIDSMLMELNNMRNSVAVETIIDIWENGTDAAKAALPDAIETLTGEEDIDSIEKLVDWYNDESGENMDDEDDEELYGPTTMFAKASDSLA